MPGFTFPTAGRLDITSPPSQPDSHSDHRYYVPLRLPKVHLRFVHCSLSAPDTLIVQLVCVSINIMFSDLFKGVELSPFPMFRIYLDAIEQYFGISHLHDNGNKARFTNTMKNLIDLMFRQFAFNLKKGAKILEVLPV